MSDYAAITHESPQRLFRFSQQRRLAIGTRLVDPQPGETILEFGGGDGFLVGKLAPLNPRTQFTIVEPFQEPLLALNSGAKNVVWVKDISECKSQQFDKLVCFEVLEHLIPDALTHFFAICHNNLRPGGRCVLSMPLEVGPPSLLKNVLRLAAGRPHEGTTWSAIIKSTFFQTDNIPRPIEGGQYPGHIGFGTFKMLRHLLAETNFVVDQTVTSPFEALPWFMNNQVYYILSHPNSRGAT